MTACIDCHSTNVELFRGDDGRHRRRCHDCGYEWGPFTSNQSSTQASLDTDSDPAEQEQPDSGTEATLSAFEDSDGE